MRDFLTIKQFLPAAPSLVPWLEHVWFVAWNLPHGREYRQRTVPFPVFNLVADEREGCALHGCSSSYFEYPLVGAGQVIGIRFKPAAQKVFFNKAAADLTDASINAGSVFSRDIVDHLDRLSCSALNIDDIARCLTSLRQSAGPMPAMALRMQHIVRYIESNPAVFRVGDLARAFNSSERTLQRQFDAHLGLPPKMVIERFRIHNAIRACADGTRPDFSALALRLGYFDQSHFINAFRRIVGMTPADYAQQL